MASSIPASRRVLPSHLPAPAGCTRSSMDGHRARRILLGPGRQLADGRMYFRENPRDGAPCGRAWAGRSPPDGGELRPAAGAAWLPARLRSQWQAIKKWTRAPPSRPSPRKRSSSYGAGLGGSELPKSLQAAGLWLNSILERSSKAVIYSSFIWSVKHSQSSLIADGGIFGGIPPPRVLG
jgi:hypothetical protein